MIFVGNTLVMLIDFALYILLDSLDNLVDCLRRGFILVGFTATRFSLIEALAYNFIDDLLETVF